jgi:hypothetical protein
MKRLAACSAFVVLTSCSSVPDEAAPWSGAEAPTATALESATAPEAAQPATPREAAPAPEPATALDSEPAPEVAPIARPTPAPAELVVHAGDRTFVVLPHEVKDVPAAGALTLVSYVNQTVTVTKEASRLPADVAVMRGRTVTVVADSGERCTANVSNVVRLVQVTPDFDDLDRFNGRPADDLGPRIAPLRNAAIAEQAYRLGEDGAHFALALDLDRESCADAHFALLSEDGESERPQPADADATASAQLAFRALPEWREHGREYAEFLARMLYEVHPDTKRTATWEGQSGAAVRRFVLGDESLLFVSAGSYDGCGGFNAGLSALFRETEDGLVLVRAWNHVSEKPLAIVGAGKGYEVIFDGVRAQTEDPGRMSAAPQFFGCSC